MKKSFLLSLLGVAVAAGATASLKAAKVSEATSEVSASYAYQFYLFGNDKFVQANMPSGAKAWDYWLPMTMLDGDPNYLAKLELTLESGMEFKLIGQKISDHNDKQYKNDIETSHSVIGNLGSDNVYVENDVKSIFTIYVNNSWKFVVDTAPTGHFVYFTESFWNQNRNFYGWYSYGPQKPYGDWAGSGFQTVVPSAKKGTYEIPGVRYNTGSGLDKVYKVPTEYFNYCSYYIINGGGSAQSANLSVLDDKFFVGGSNNDDEDARKALYFVENYMSMGTDTANQCQTLYPAAETAYGKLSGSVQNAVQNKFSEAYQRYNAWAVAYGQANPSGALTVISSSNGTNAIAVSSGLAALGVAAAGTMIFFARKRKDI